MNGVALARSPPTANRGGEALGRHRRGARRTRHAERRIEHPVEPRVHRRPVIDIEERRKLLAVDHLAGEPAQSAGGVAVQPQGVGLRLGATVERAQVDLVVRRGARPVVVGLRLAGDASADEAVGEILGEGGKQAGGFFRQQLPPVGPREQRRDRLDRRQGGRVARADRQLSPLVGPVGQGLPRGVVRGGAPRVRPGGGAVDQGVDHRHRGGVVRPGDGVDHLSRQAHEAIEERVGHGGRLGRRFGRRGRNRRREGGRFGGGLAVQLMAQARDRLIDGATHPVDAAQRPMGVEAMPGVERQGLAERPALRRVEALARDRQARHRHEGRVVLAPFDGRVLDRHRRRIALQLDADIERRVAGLQGPDQVVAQEIRGGAVLERRGRTGGAGRNLARPVPVEVRRHAPIAAVQRVGDPAADDRQGPQRLVQSHMQRIEVWDEEPERVLGAVQDDIFGRVLHEERRVVDQDDVLRAASAVGNLQDLDRHAAAVARLVRRGRTRTVREPDPGRVGRRAREKALRQVGRQAVEHLQPRLDAAVHLGMGVAPRRRIGGGRGAHPLGDHLGDLGYGVGLSRRDALPRRAVAVTGRNQGGKRGFGAIHRRSSPDIQRRDGVWIENKRAGPPRSQDDRRRSQSSHARHRGCGHAPPAPGGRGAFPIRLKHRIGFCSSLRSGSRPPRRSHWPPPPGCWPRSRRPTARRNGSTPSPFRWPRPWSNGRGSGHRPHGPRRCW